MHTYLEGTVNVHRNRIGTVLIYLTGAHFSVATHLRFPCANNNTEYKACINGLKATLDMSIKDLEVYVDSRLIRSQSVGEWEVRSPELIKDRRCLNPAN